MPDRQESLKEMNVYSQEDAQIKGTGKKERICSLSESGPKANPWEVINLHICMWSQTNVSETYVYK